MQRIHLLDKFTLNDHAQLVPEIFHHLFIVCRLKVGSKLEIVINENRLLLVQIKKVTENGFNYIILDQFSLISPRKIPINIIQSLPKQDKITEICKLCTEVGVANIYPVISDYCDVQVISSNKLKRINNSILSAVNQSKQMLIPQFHDCLPLKDRLNKISLSNNSLFLVAYEASLVQLSEIINIGTFDSIYIAIGPEGGFSQTDLLILNTHDFKDFTLGSSILRTEHAAFAAINYLDGFLSNFP